MGDCTVKMLPSRYWHVRWNPERWCQWPVHREATAEDAFGDMPVKIASEANAAVAARKLLGDDDG